MSLAVVSSAVAPLLGSPDVRAELVSQAPLGALLTVEGERSGFLEARGDDGCRGWIHQGYVLMGDPAEAAAWREEAHLMSLGAVLSLGGRARLALPLGARVAPAPDGAVRLPDGRIAEVASGRLAERGVLHAEARAMSAAGWARVFFAGAPYLWGGVTPWGVDCSGLVQTTFRMRGTVLPRDTREQVDAGTRVPADTLHYPFTAGDLLFFGEPTSVGQRSAARFVTHVAIADGEGSVVHAALAAGGVCISPLSGDSAEAERLRATYVGARRLA